MNKELTGKSVGLKILWCTFGINEMQSFPSTVLQESNVSDGVCQILLRQREKICQFSLPTPPEPMYASKNCSLFSHSSSVTALFCSRSAVNCKNSASQSQGTVQSRVHSFTPRSDLKWPVKDGKKYTVHRHLVNITKQCHQVILLFIQSPKFDR